MKAWRRGAGPTPPWRAARRHTAADAWPLPLCYSHPAASKHPKTSSLLGAAWLATPHPHTYQEVRPAEGLVKAWRRGAGPTPPWRAARRHTAADAWPLPPSTQIRLACLARPGWPHPTLCVPQRQAQPRGGDCEEERGGPSPGGAPLALACRRRGAGWEGVVARNAHTRARTHNHTHTHSKHVSHTGRTGVYLADHKAVARLEADAGAQLPHKRERQAVAVVQLAAGAGRSGGTIRWYRQAGGSPINVHTLSLSPPHK